MIGIVGEPQAGKSSLLALLLAGDGARRGKSEHEVSVPVPDPRLQWLASIYQPKKTTPTRLEFADVGGDSRNAGKDLSGLLAMADLRNCEGLALVLDRFSGDAGDDDLAGFELATAVADLELVDRRLEKLIADRKRGLKETEAEIPLMERLKTHLENGQPLRTLELGADERARIRGYQFLSLKPVLVVANVAEEETGAGGSAALAAACAVAGHVLCPLSAPLEAEIATLDPDARAEFMAELGIETPAVDRFIRSAYESLGLICFLTAGPDECRAWTVRRGASAPEAAGRIHSDLQRGFIRAEVIAFDDFHRHGDEKAAKAAGVHRLEGRDYVVRDGDVMEIRFSV